MSTALREPPARRAGTGNGGFPARRAVTRWAWRMFRREWRQQLLVLALITVAVAATIIGSAVAVNTPPPANAGFGTAQDLATYPGTSPHLAAQIAALRHRFGRTDVIENQALSVPGSVQAYDLRAQNPRGPFGGPMLSLVSGHYPTGPGQVAVTSGVASAFRLKTGDFWRAGGTARRVTGIVENPQDLQDEFALVVPGQVRSPTQVSVLFDARGVNPASIGRNVESVSQAAPKNVINPETVSLAAATLGMLLIALVGAGGFTVLAQRRLRAIGMLGAQGATDRDIRLVVRANGLTAGVTGALAGCVLGLAAWLACRPAVESSTHHLIGVFQLPWQVVILAMALAVITAYLAAAWPAWAAARVPVMAALSGRPPTPKLVHRWAVPTGAALLVIAFLLLGIAGGSGTQGDMPALVLGFVALTVAVVTASPACLAVLPRLAGRAPVTVRLALRDMVRYRSRSGPALGAISLSVLIAVIIIVASAARFGNVLDYSGPNLVSSRLIVHTPRQQFGSRHTGGMADRTVTPQAMAKAAHGIAAALGAHSIIQLKSANATLQHAAYGRNWTGPVYVATPQLLHTFGIKASQAGPTADILTMRPGLSTMPKMQLIYGNYLSGQGPPGGGKLGAFPCPKGECMAHPVIVEASALPSGTSAPNTVITEHAIRQLHLHVGTSGWLIQTPNPLTAAQIHNARQAAAAAGMTIETRNNIPSLPEILDVATVSGILLALGILATSVGLVRSETASDLRTLAATGASGTARRSITATTAGTLALAGAVIGTACGYLAVIGFLRTNHLDPLSSLTSVAVANLLLILVGMPLVAVIAGWLLAGHEPTAIAHQPLE